MKKNILLSLIFAIVCSTSSSFAAVTPISVSIAPPVQFPPQDFSITGIRLSALWGHHRDVYGLDFGVLGNITDQDFVGIGIAGGFNATYGSTNIIGLQLAGLGNYNQQKTNVVGLQAAIISNINVAESNVYGVQLAVTNLSNSTSVYGAQLGIYNRAKSVYGIQLGLVNITDNLHGLQIGLVNFNHTGVFKVSPILNVGF